MEACLPTTLSLEDLKPDYSGAHFQSLTRIRSSLDVAGVHKSTDDAFTAARWDSSRTFLLAFSRLFKEAPKRFSNDLLLNYPALSDFVHPALAGLMLNDNTSSVFTLGAFRLLFRHLKF